MSNLTEIFKKVDPAIYPLLGEFDSISFLDTALLMRGYEPIHDKFVDKGEDVNIPFSSLPFIVQETLLNMSRYIELEPLGPNWTDLKTFKNKHEPKVQKYEAFIFFELHFLFKGVSQGSLYLRPSDRDIYAPKDVTNKELVQDVQLMNKLIFKKDFAVMMWGLFGFLWPSTNTAEEGLWKMWLSNLKIDRESLKFPMSNEDVGERVAIPKTPASDEVSNSTSDLETKKEILYGWTQRVEFITHCHKSLNTLIRPINQQDLIHPMCLVTRTWMNRIGIEMTNANFKYVWNVITGIVRWDPKRDSQIYGSMDYFRELYFKPNK